MEASAYLIISGLVLILSFLLFKKASGSMALREINMLSYLFYVPLILMSAIGSIFIVLHIDEHYLINKLHHDQTRILAWAAIMYTMLSFPIGLLLAKRIMLKSSVQEAIKNYRAKSIEALLGKHELILKSILVCLSLIGILSMLYTFYSLGSLPIVELIKGNSSALAKLRISASREFGGNVYIRNIFGLQFLPLLSFVALAYYKMSKKYYDFFWFLLCFFSSILMLTYDLQKSPMAMYLSGILFFWVWVEGKLSKKAFVFGTASFIGVIVLFYLGFGVNNLSEIFLQYNEGASGRVLFSQVAGTFFSFEIFGKSHEFIEWNSLSNLVEHFGLEYSERAGRIIMEYINP
ncbi:MAG: hypothetical protein KDC82_00325, partial [Bacteroidetes bacterium]|nr:hypothetical protein [Bacteroidota bacterium]